MDIDSILESVLIFIAIVIATYSVISFTSVELLSSPLTLSSLILLIGFLAHLILVYTKDDKLQYAGYVILSVYAISVFSYLIVTFSVNATTRTVSLMLLSALILSGVYSIRNNIEVLSQRNLVIIVIFLVLLSGTLVGIDVLTEEPTDRVVVADSLSSSENGESLVIGQIVAQNPSILPKSYEPNSYVACVSQDISATDEDTRPENIGYSSISDNIVWNQRSENIEIPSRGIAEYASQNNISVVKTDRCPSDLDNRTIAIYPNA
jgi:hypothetical protein